MNNEKNEKFIPEICKIKHKQIDEDISYVKTNVDNINEDVKNIKEDNIKHNEEIKNMIVTLTHDVKSSNQNLKNKIILSEKTTGDKIDALNNFDDSLKGNGDPGIWESIRNIKRNVKMILCAMIIIIILVLGGNYRGISLDKIKKAIKIKKETKQIEPVLKSEVKTTPKPLPKVKTTPKPLPNKIK